jgi:hypothetical protein
MRNLKKIVFLTAMLIGICGVQHNAFAGPASISTKIAPPSSILVGQQAVGEYTVTNNSSVSLQIVNQSNLPAGTVLTTGTGYCGSSIILPAHGSCVFGFTLPAQNSPIQLTGQVIESIGPHATVAGNPFTVVVSTEPQPGMPTLSIADSNIYLQPGVQESIEVKNTSATVAANSVHFKLPEFLSTQIAIATGCSVIAPLATCKMSMTAKVDAVFGKLQAISIQGANTYLLAATVSLVAPDPGEVIAEAVSFDVPMKKSLHLVNSSAQPAYVTSILFPPASVQGVDVGAYSQCATIAPNGGFCDVDLTATNKAYGTGPIQIKYTLAGIAKTANTNVMVANTDLELYELVKGQPVPVVGNEIKVEEERSPQTFQFRNTGQFYWQGVNLNITGSTGVTIDAGTCSAGSSVPVAGQCTFKILTGAAARPGVSALLATTGLNIAEVHDNVIVDGGLTMTADESQTHLGYRAIKIQNNTNFTAKVASVDITGLDPTLIKYCTVNDDDCIHQTDSNCDKDGGDLLAHSFCYVWLKALKNDAAAFATNLGTISVTATSDWPPPTSSKSRANDFIPIAETETFDVNYKQDLYVGFSFASTFGFVSKWDGTAWSFLAPLDSGVNTLAMRDDLYVGGVFAEAGAAPVSNIAKWNGTNFLPLGTQSLNGVNGEVKALLVQGNDLYVGGDFSTASGVPSQSIARWDGASWHALSSGTSPSSCIVKALASVNKHIYAGGSFTNIQGTAANYIAEWNGTQWLPLGVGVIAGVQGIEALTSAGNDLYVGGAFITAGGNSAKNLAKWSDTDQTWSYIPAAEATSSSAEVAAIFSTTISGNSIQYIGGTMNKAGTTDVTNIYKWDGSSVDSMAGGVGRGSFYFDYIVDAITGIMVNGVYNVYIAGSFTLDLPDQLYGIAHWDGTSWLPVGNPGIDGRATDLLIAPSLVVTKIYN